MAAGRHTDDAYFDQSKDGKAFYKLPQGKISHSPLRKGLAHQSDPNLAKQGIAGDAMQLRMSG